MNLKIWEVIKYEGNNHTLVWKHEAEDFNTHSTLIVQEPMEAILFSNGQVADVFPAGKYVLETGNIPVLRRLLQIPTGGVSTFHCQVYFVNKVEVMALRWGTDSKVQFIEPTYNFPMEIGARGSLSLRIRDSAGFVTRLIGAESSIMPETIVRYFRSFIQNRVKSQLARTIKEQQLNIFEIDTQLDVLSDARRDRLRRDFEEYGVDLAQFLIEEVVRPEDDLNYIRVKDLTAQRFTNVFEAQTQAQVNLIRQQTESQMRVMEAQSMAQKRQLEGYTYQDERSFDVAQTVAQNENTGQFTGMGMGLGMMAGVGGTLGGTVAGMVSGAMNGIQTAPPAPGVVPAGSPGVPQAGAGQNMAEGTGQNFASGGYGAGVVQQNSGSMGSAAEGGQQNPATGGMQQNPVPGGVQPADAPTGTKTCECGAVISFRAKFCPECGKPQPKLCPGCGKAVGDAAKFCDECGTRLQ